MKKLKVRKDGSVKLNRPLVEKLGLVPGKVYEVEVQEDKIVIKPVEDNNVGQDNQGGASADTPM